MKRRVQVGDIVTRTASFTEIDCLSPAKRLKGKVVYVHPRGRYHTVEFKVRSSFIRESYRGVVAGEDGQ